jgi:hypothetical protein
MDKTLGEFEYGDYGDVGEYGNVDFFGLDEFGAPVGMNPMYGALIGTGLATGTAIALRAMTAKGGFFHKNSELLGLAVGGLAGGAMMFSPGTRAAGLTAIGGAFLSNGLRQLESWLLPSSAPALGLPYIEMGGPVIEPAQTLGVVLPEQTQTMAGAQISGDGPPIDISLQGALSASAIEQIQGIEGPDLSGLGTHYGATLFGARQ